MYKKIIVFIGLLLVTCAAIAQQLPPKSNTIVTDYTNTLSADEKQRLENKLVAFNDSSSTQIAVVMIHSIGDYEASDYAQKLGRAWGVGQKGNNNGIMFLVAVDDHKMSIQVGYGLEGALPDIIARQILRNSVTPRFKAGDYFGGLDAGTTDIIKYTKGEYKAPKKAKQAKDNDGSPIGFIVIIVVVILIAVFRNRGGGGGQVIGSRGGASPFWWLLAGSALGRSSNGGGWGGFSGGGGGNSGGGGFGGFGGGDFGGGGASGSW